jgi:hypothetical protein
MAKYGWFASGVTKPFDTFEGDYMRHNDAYVEILKRSTRSSASDSIVAIISLRTGEMVREIQGEGGARR